MQDKSLVAHAEEEVIIPTPLFQDKTEIYYKNGTRYVPYVLYDLLPFYHIHTPGGDDSGGPPGGDGDIQEKGDISDTWIDME